MTSTNPAQLREKFTTEAGRAAFDKLNALGPRWVYFEEPDRIYLGAQIETYTDGGNLRTPGAEYADTIDEAAIEKLRALEEAAAEPSKVVVVNANSANRADFTYNSTARTFIPRPH